MAIPMRDLLDMDWDRLLGWFREAEAMLAEDDEMRAASER